MLGVVNLDKPVGPTSHDMVALFRRLSGVRRIGHAGTLDPLASGVLPILVGHATRFSEELSGGDKRYEAVIRLGARSETDDAEGPIADTGIPVPGDDAIADDLQAFVGVHLQRPPAYSARKVAGRAAYRAARGGETVELPARPVTVHAIELRSIERGSSWTDVAVAISCQAGTYVRALARDLGDRLGCGGYLHALRRTEAAGLSVAAARTPRELEALAAADRLAEAVEPVASLLGLPTVRLDADQARRFTNGLAVQTTGAEGRVAVLSEGRLLGIGVTGGGTVRPVKVIPASAA